MKLSRRNFLHTAGLSAALVPTLHLGRARAAGTPKRIITCAWTNGFWREELWPDGEGADFKLRKILSPLEPYKKDLLVVAGATLQNFLEPKSAPKAVGPGSGHDAYAAIFTGEPLAVYAEGNVRAGGDSVDQYIADRLSPATPVKNLVVGAARASGLQFQDAISYRANTTGVTPENNPARLFSTLFQGRSLDKGAIDKIMLKRQSVLDHVGKSLDGFAKRVSPEDRDRVLSHAASVRDLEKQIQALAAGPTCNGAPAAPNVDAGNEGNYPAVIKAQTDLIVAALRCNLTRVVSFVLQDAGGNQVMSWLGPEFQGGGDEFPVRSHHDIAHNRKKSAAHRDRHIRVAQWFFEQVAYLAKQLAATPDVGGGSMLDNTMIVVGAPMHQNHTVYGTPWIIIGGGWYFKTGRFLKLGPWKGVPSVGQGTSLDDEKGFWTKDYDKLPAHNGILVGLCNAMGVPTVNFGPAKWGGEFPELRG